MRSKKIILIILSSSWIYCEGRDQSNIINNFMVVADFVWLSFDKTGEIYCKGVFCSGGCWHNEWEREVSWAGPQVEPVTTTGRQPAKGGFTEQVCVADELVCVIGAEHGDRGRCGSSPSDLQQPRCDVDGPCGVPALPHVCHAIRWGRTQVPEMQEQRIAWCSERAEQQQQHCEEEQEELSYHSLVWFPI